MHDTDDSTEEPGFELPPTRDFPTWILGKVQVKVAAMNAKAAKLGLPPFELTIGEPYLVSLPQEPGDLAERFEERAVVGITGAPIHLSGYRFLARVDFEEGATLVNVRPGEVVPPRYRQATTFCDHCASKRRRNAVFIFRREGGEQHIQVGRSCLRDFLGYEPTALLWSVREWSRLNREFDEELGARRREHEQVGVQRILEMTAAVMRNDSGVYRSSSWAKDHEGATSTASEVTTQLFPPRPLPRDFVKVAVTEEDIDRAAAALAWATEAIVGKDELRRSDYEQNLAQLITQPCVRLPRISMVASLMSAYARHLGDREKRAERINAWVGEVGKRREFEAVFAGASAYDTYYGTTFIGRFETPAGLLVYKGSSPFWDGALQVGAAVRFVATIKEHADYKGLKQTLIQRVKLAQEAVAA
jgi:hypothetical protein